MQLMARNATYGKRILPSSGASTSFRGTRRRTYILSGSLRELFAAEELFATRRVCRVYRGHQPDLSLARNCNWNVPLLPGLPGSLLTPGCCLNEEQESMEDTRRRRARRALVKLF